MKPTNLPYDSSTFNKATIQSKRPALNNVDQSACAQAMGDNCKRADEEQNLIYDFKQDFTPEELANEPRPEVAWVHLSCAYWLPELEFGLETIKEPITGLEEIDSKRYKLVCAICKQRGVGCCVQCGKGKCQAAYHVECARLAGLYMEFVTYKGESTMNTVFCEKHRPLKLRKAIEQMHKNLVDDVASFCKVVEKCRATAEKYENVDEKAKNRKTVTNKFFTKIEKKRLMTRIRHICKKFGLMTINLSKQTGGEGAEKYKVSPNTFKISYADTLSKRGFPWNEVKFGKFTAQNCYNKYTSIVPNEEAFMRKVLHLGKKRIEKEERNKHKFMSQLKVAPVAVEENDPVKYCYCAKTVKDRPQEKMIGRQIV